MVVSKMAHRHVTLSIEETVWLDFKAYIARHKDKTASGEVENYMKGILKQRGK